MTATGSILSVEGLRVSYPGRYGGRVEVLSGVDLTVKSGETLGLVGESGSGKSVTALAILGLLARGGRVDGGVIRYGDRELTFMSSRGLRSLRGREMSMIFQDPVASLNPAFTVGSQIAEVVARHTGASRRAAFARALELLIEVGITHAGRRMNQYPHEFSGGMCQRIVIALALAAEPSLLFADEPTTALDVTTQAQIVELLRRLATDREMSIVFTTHDLALVSEVADRVAVMYAGRVVEIGPIRDVFTSPRHPYTHALLECAVNTGVEGETVPIQGAPPAATAMPTGCRFHPRCPYAIDRCAATPPELSLGTGHADACHRSHELELQGVSA